MVSDPTTIAMRPSASFRDVPVSGTAGVIGVAAALPVIGILHDLVPAHPPAVVSWFAALGVALCATWVLGRPVARSIAARAGSARMSIALIAAPLGALPAMLPLVGLLRGATDPVAQLAWTLAEEDNAQIIGLAREVITTGPGGGVLADQYGTGVIVMATTMMRMLGIPDPMLDPRFLAIHAFTLSALLAVGVLAMSIGLIVTATTAALPVEPRWRALRTLSLGVTVTVVAAVATTVVVMVPMRTGFLTFVWGMAWTALATAVAALAAHAAERSAAIVAVITVLACALLLIRSWPFLGAAMVPAVAITLARLPLDRVVAAALSHPVATGAVGVVVAASGLLYLNRSAFGEVVSYGLDALTISASGIEFPEGVGLAAAIAALSVALLVSGPAGRLRAVVTVAGPATLGWLSWVVLNGAAVLLTDGELNYGGTKLLYGVVGVAIATALPVTATVWTAASGARTLLPAVAAGIVALLVATGSPEAELERWATRLEPSAPPHAVAMIEAVQRTTPELPVRCRPEPGTAVTPVSRWAAYFCVRWVEDALNGTGRDDGKRIALLNAPDGTFDAIVAEADAEGLYGFAYVMPLGPGWFGWDGRS